MNLVDQNVIPGCNMQFHNLEKLNQSRKGGIERHSNTNEKTKPKSVLTWDEIAQVKENTTQLP